MEIQRVAAASTFVTFPMLSTAASMPLTGVAVTGTWVAWSDTQGPNAAGNPGFRTLTGAITEIGVTGYYTNALAATEIPLASPWVLLRYTGALAFTQTLLLRSASLYTNITGVNGSPIAASVTAGYMPIDIKQTIALTAGGAADNSVEKSLARMYFATQYVQTAIVTPPTAAVNAAAVWDEVILGAHTVDNTAGKMAGRLYFATDYLNAPVSSALTLATALNLTSPADNTVGKTLSRSYFATQYINASIAAIPTLATALTLDGTAADNSVGKFMARGYFATQYLQAPVPIAAPTAAVNASTLLGSTITLGSPADNTVDKALARMYFATQYLDAAITSRFASGGTLAAVGAGAITSGSFAAGAIDAAAIAANAIGSSELAADGGSAYADAFLGRTIDRSGSGGRTVGQAMMALRNKVSISAGTLTVTGVDDATTEWTATIATQAVTAIVTSIDPA